ncbi:MAG: hypothetical protein QG600_9 [Patescibacteria group bacterium]|nr:hypothetical protein [Patescibacteria group bacterium]
MKKNLPLILSGIIVLILGAYLLNAKQASTTPSQLSPSPSASSQQFLTVTPDMETLERGGSSYTHPQNLYTFLYPNNYKLDAPEDGMITRIYMQGATQRGQTELYDGALFVVEAIDLKGQTLNDFVNERISVSTADGTSQIIEEKKSTMLNVYPGFTFKMRGLGEATYLFLQKDTTSTSAIGITYSVFDPEMKNYQEDINAVLNSFEIHK